MSCFAAAILLSGCALVSPDAPLPTAPPPCAVRGLVFAVDGAGGFELFSRTVRNAASLEKMPLEVRCFRWSHGYCRVFADQVHRTHLHRQGRKLAERVMASLEESPSRPIFLIGHSAGCGVVLAAAENLPPDVLERIVLLAPAVSASHDLRPALASARRGIDVFVSHHDWACLGLGTLFAGTTDGLREYGAAGKIGFQQIDDTPEDAALYAKLRQFRWNSSLKWTGHQGGHYGAYQSRFLHFFVLPLLAPGVDE